MDSESTLDIGYLISTYTQSLREFFRQKIAELEAFSDYQAQQIEDLTNKVMMLGLLALLLIVAIIVVSICFKVSRKRKKKARLEEAEERLRREEQRLREERRYYEAQRRNMQQGYGPQGYDGYGGYDDLGYRDDRYGRDEYRDEWSPQKKKRSVIRDYFPEREPKEVRQRAERETTYISRPDDFDDFDDFDKKF
ncbi:MAG: hypothetical protein MR991_01380 [Clostridiales bacterium]|nr:hypothetical protein [Clostridiales bacterium]MDD7035472.1 hypothetical protein [Bacillota bacterium]MDY2919945.1 hypothetical protein [Lentihominibacter sp.]